MHEAGLSIHTSNRLDLLVEQLASALSVDPPPPLEHELVVVQSQGMRRWLTLALASRLGVAANLRMPFPQGFCHELADDVLDLGDSPGGAHGHTGSAFGRELLTWRILATMAGWDDDPAFAAPAAYFRDDPDGRKRYQLARRVADVFDNYQLFRPSMLLEWEREELREPAVADGHEQWQARLWRQLVADTDEEHLARRFARLTARLRDTPRQPSCLPARVSVFGVSTLAPASVDLLVAMSRFVPVSVYMVSPTYHYWGDIRSERESARLQRRLQRGAPCRPEDLHLESGNPLLATLGAQGRDFFGLLQQADADGTAWQELDFVDPWPDTDRPASALHVLQSDVLNMRTRGRGDDSEAPVRLEADDDSLVVNVCHSPMREMEVLRDHILDAFERDADMRPDDVLVMVTDIERYAPYVEAVFGAPEAGCPALPFSIADRGPASTRQPVRALLALLDLIDSRVTAADVFDLLELTVVSRRFGLSADDVATARAWAQQANVRWGVDAEQRRLEHGLAGIDANSWRRGLDRLLMGYATGDVDGLVAGIAPQGNAALAAPETLGRFAWFADVLFDQLARLRSPRGAAAWATDLLDAVDLMIEADGDDDEQALGQVRDTLGELASAERRAGLESAGLELTLAVVREHLATAVEADSLGHGFISGRITFCALKPMRTIPFAMICVAGLGERQFPRRDRAAGFDLMADHPAAGDRSLRADDRYLFLETLLSAGKRLVLSYEGRSQHDNSELAPAVVVSELLDQVDRSFEAGAGMSAGRQVTVEHKLHPFDSAYFDPDHRALFSYAAESCEISKTAEAAPRPAPSFIASGLDVEEPDVIALADLVSFWLHPSKHFVRSVLQIYLDDGTGELAESERFALDGLERYQLEDWMLARRLAGDVAPGAELALLRARGDLPLAGLGSANYERTRTAVDSFHAALPEHRPIAPLAIDIGGDGWRVGGVIEGRTDIGLLRYRPASLKAKDIVGAWVEHVALGAAGTEHACVTHILGTDATEQLAPVDDAMTVLAALVDGYRAGRRAPLPVFPATSHAWAERELALRAPKSGLRTSALHEARKKWKGTQARAGYRGTPGESTDPYVMLCVGDDDPLADAADAFVTWAERLWMPILAARAGESV